jgi:hypothetical protein
MQIAPPHSLSGSVMYAHIHIYITIKWMSSFNNMISLICIMLNLHLSTLVANTTWQHPPVSYMWSSFWCKPIERYLTPHRNNNVHTYHELVHKALLKLIIVSRDHMIPLFIVFMLCLLINLDTLSVWLDQYRIIFFLHYYDVLKIKMNICSPSLVLQDILDIVSILS